MIIVKIIGGLGNQMFQIAFAKALAIDKKDEIYLDISSYKNYKIRNFGINNLKIFKDVKIYNLNYSNDKFYLISQVFYRIFQKVLKIITNDLYIGEKVFKILCKKNLIYNFDPYYYELKKIDISKDIFIYGYFQSEKYFYRYKNQIIEDLKIDLDFCNDEKKLLEQMKNCNSVAISIRLGKDYKNSKSLNICSDKYFMEAINIIKEKLDNPVFFVFSDEIQKAKKLSYLKNDFIFIENFNEYQSMRLMYNCKNFIISNSSFSWWGSYLSENEDKIVISPDIWYNNVNIQPDIFTKNMLMIPIE